MAGRERLGVLEADPGTPLWSICPVTLGQGAHTGPQSHAHVSPRNVRARPLARSCPPAHSPTKCAYLLAASPSCCGPRATPQPGAPPPPARQVARWLSSDSRPRCFSRSETLLRARATRAWGQAGRGEGRGGIKRMRPRGHVGQAGRQAGRQAGVGRVTGLMHGVHLKTKATATAKDHMCAKQMQCSDVEGVPVGYSS